MNSILQTLAGWLTTRTPAKSPCKPRTTLGVETLEDRQLPSASLLGAAAFKPWDAPVVAKTTAASEKATPTFAVTHDAKSDDSALTTLDLAAVSKSREATLKSSHPATDDHKSDEAEKKSSHLSDTKSNATEKKSSHPATGASKSDANEKKSSHPATGASKSDANEKKSSHSATGASKSDANDKKSSDPATSDSKSNVIEIKSRHAATAGGKTARRMN